MLSRPVLLTCLLIIGSAPSAALVSSAPSPPQSDLDAFMEKVLARRDDNWKKLQQYVLEERETFQFLGPGQIPLYGFRKEYAWFVREGFFVRSPVRADGVTLSDEERRRAEDAWLRRQQRREQRNAQREGREPIASAEPGAVPGDVLLQSIEPGFVSSAYFLRFKFDQGQYALAGREPLDGREVLRIEYYPTKLFTEGRTRPNRELRERDDDVEEKMNKSSLVTLWVEPEAHQILQYEFDNIDMDFLPGRSLVRVDGMKASMRMSEPFPGVWLPRSVAMRFDLATAMGGVNARYDVEYYDYRLATVTTRVR